MSGGFSFRYKVRLSWGSRLPFDEPEWKFPANSHDLRVGSMKQDLTLRQSEWIVLRGDDYDTEAKASDAGMEARHILQRSFAALGLGADFGDHHRGGLSLAEHFKKELEAKVGAPILTDTRYLLTFPSEPRPQIVGFSAEGRADPTTPDAVKALTHPGARVPLTDREGLAHQFFGASFFVHDSPEARLLLLMAAVEAQLDFQSRSDETRGLIRSWLDDVQAAQIDPAECESLVGQLSFLTKESISQAGQRMVATVLGGRRYNDLDPDIFFRRTYGLRSRVAHPSHKPPNRQHVVNSIPPLQAMVGDLLAGPAMLTT